MITRRDFLKKIFVTTGALTLAGCAGSDNITAGKKQPNIIFILADDLGNHDLSCTGSEVYQTPNIDRLAMEGMYFRQAHAPFPTCAPSRMSIVTGKYPARLGCWNHGTLGTVEGEHGDLPLREVTYAEVFRQAGYVTGHIGKWHCGEQGYMPQDQGYDYVYGANDFCCIGSYYFPYQALDIHPKARLDLDDMDTVERGEHLTRVLSQKVVDFIHENKGRPFMLDYWDYAPHTPLEADRDKIEKYKRLMNPDGRQLNPGYAALLEHYDEAVGRVLKAVDDAGIADNTVIIFTSDNGGAVYKHPDVPEFADVPVTSNYPLRDGKHSQYSGGTRVPAFVRWPGITTPGSVCDERIIGFDFYPTMLKIAGIKGDAEHNRFVDGYDLTPLLKDPSAKLSRKSLHWLRYPEMRRYLPGTPKEKGPCGTILEGDWKLVEYPATLYGQEQSFELYNVKDDISEKRDLAAVMPEKVERLKRKMYAWRRDVGTPVDCLQMYIDASK